jgi:hypothetical protein
MDMSNERTIFRISEVNKIGTESLLDITGCYGRYIGRI